LIAARVLQALGGCAGLLLGRTIVSDTAAPEETVRRMALMNLLITVGPAVAPLLGAAIAPWLGWRAIGGCATTATYAYVTAAPFIVVRQLQRPAHEVGIYLTLVIAGLWFGSATAARLAGRVPADRLLLGGQALSVVSSLALLAVVWTGGLSPASLAATVGLFALGAGVASPGAIAQALSVDPRVAGSATGLYGCTQMAVGATCSALVVLGTNRALSTALVLAGASLVGQLCLRFASRQGP
jgi:DHA1 family bicyclomycin/chloramphenicol resistance-like MFS transporter